MQELTKKTSKSKTKSKKKKKSQARICVCKEFLSDLKAILMLKRG
jgi:hypothetical protein